MFEYRIMYGGKTPDGKYTENVMEFTSEDEITSQEDLVGVLRTIGHEKGYLEVGLTKIEQIVENTDNAMGR